MLIAGIHRVGGSPRQLRRVSLLHGLETVRADCPRPR
jgi:hypothetical protein